MLSPRKGPILGALLFILLAACESDPARSPEGAPMEPVPDDPPQVGGQTGTEGGCIGTLEPSTQPSPLSPEAVRELIVGHHETTLAYRDFVQSVDAALEDEPGTRMTVDVATLGDAPEAVAASECGTINQFFDVRLRGGEPPVETRFRGQAASLTSDEVTLLGSIAPEIALQLGLLTATFDPRYDSPALVPASLMMYFDVGGLRGQITSGTLCGAMSFPAGRRCAKDGMREVEPDADTLDALNRLSELREIPVQWRDSAATTLSVELLEEPSRFCGARRAVGAGNDKLDVPLRVRVSTADGRARLTLPVHLERHPGIYRDAWKLLANVLLPADALSNDEKLVFEVPDESFVMVTFQVFRDPAPTRANLDLATVAREPRTPPVTGLIDLMAEGREGRCYGVRTPLANAATP